LLLVIALRVTTVRLTPLLPRKIPIELSWMLFFVMT
jgi:hypothetical protein